VVLEIRQLGDPVLRYPAPETEFDPVELKNIINDMTETLRQVKGLGLAGPQVGILKRVFVYDLGEGIEVLLNPKITWESEETEEDTEGCLSIPGREVTVRRCVSVKVEGQNETGARKIIDAEGLMARMFQHEIDHLNGLMIIDRTTEEERRAVLKDMIREDRK
jgi:peptide deformylase